MSRYRRCVGINETPVEDELFLIAGDSGDIFHLDHIAMSIWRALAEPATEAELQALFAAAFPDTPAAAITRDLTDALAILLRGKLVEICD